MLVSGHSRSLKMVPFESFGTISYSHSIVTMAVSSAISEIFSVKEWSDLEIWVWGQLHLGSRCQLSAVVGNSVISESLVWRWIISWVRGHSRSLKLVPFERLGAVSYSPPIVTMALYCISSEIKLIVWKSWFFHTPLHSALPLGGSRRNIDIPFGTGKLD